MDPFLNGGAGSSSNSKKEGKDTPVLFSISEDDDVQQSLIPGRHSRRDTNGGSSPESSEEEDNVEGVIGTTPPKAHRLGKTRRRAGKLKRTPSPYEYKEKQRNFSKKRPHSADLGSAMNLDNPPPLGPEHPRRHTVSDVSSSKKTYGFASYASFDNGKSNKADKESGKKKKEKLRKQERSDKISSNHRDHPPIPILAEPTPLLESIPIPTVSEPLPDSTNPTQALRRHPLVTSLTSHTLKLIDEEGGRPRVSRSHSDAQFSLTLSSTQSTRCPPDRNKFFKNFRKTLGLLYKRQQQGPAVGAHISSTGFHVPRQHSENLTIDNPFAHQIDQIWRELRAWESGRSLEEQEDWDFDHHREVELMLNRIINYRFDQHSDQEMNKDFFAGTDRERDEYEPLMSLGGRERGGDLNNGHSNNDTGHQGSDDHTPLASLGAGTTERTIGPGKINFDEEDDEGGPRTLTQTKSDSSESSVTSKSSSDYSYERFLLPEQVATLSEVEQLLEELENVESLYSNSRKIGDENPKYRQPSFRRKRDALVLWSKVTRGLADHLSRLSKWFGVPIISQPSSVHTPITPSRNNSDTGSHPLGVSISDLSIDPELSLGGLSRFSSGIFLSQVSQLSQMSSSSKCSTGRMSAPRTVSNIDSYPSLSKGYRKFVDRMLKKKDIEWLIDELKDFIKSIFAIADEAIKVRNDDMEEGFNEDEAGFDPPRESWPLLAPYVSSSALSPKISRRISSSPRCWLDEFDEMNLPSFFQLYIQLARVPLDIMQECMRQKTTMDRVTKPSAYSIRKLIQECHMTISQGVEVRSYYRLKASLIIRDNPGKYDLVDADMAGYEKDLKNMLQLYFSYVRQLVEVIGTYKELLEEEWIAAKKICVDITNGEVEAGLNFCHLASELMDKLNEDLKSMIDDCCDNLHEKSLEDHEDQKQPFIESCRTFKQVIQNARESAMKSLGFAKTLMKDLEIAANFSIRGTPDELLNVLRSSDHVQVTIPQRKGCMLFIPQQIANKTQEIQDLLHVSFGHSKSYSDSESDPHSSPPRPGFGSPEICYLLVVKFSSLDSDPEWKGATLDLIPSAENILSISEMQVEGIKMIVPDSQLLEECRTSFFQSVGNVVEIEVDKTSSHQSVADRISDLKLVLCNYGHTLIEMVERVDSNLSEEVNEKEDEQYRSTLHTFYNFAFEYIKEMTRLLGEEFVHIRMGLELMNFAQHWMIFVVTKCKRGFGKIPRWSGPGLDFLLLACSPRMLASMADHRYESLKKQMDKCIEHLVGDDNLRQPTNIGEIHVTQSSVFSPVGGVPNRPTTWQRPPVRRRIANNNRSLSVQPSPLHHSPLVQRKSNLDDLDGSGLSPPMSNDSITSSGIDSPPYIGTPIDSGSYMKHTKIEPLDNSLLQYYNDVPDLAGTPAGPVADWTEKKDKKREEIEEKCREIDAKRERYLKTNGVIGREIKLSSSGPMEFTKLTTIKQTHFNWRRGRKLGEGQFGKVYECFNLDKGEVNAVKRISLMDKTHNKVRDILSEIQVFVQIKHPNIVNLFGVEIHQTDLYIFMEYCNEGSLWTAIKQGLTEMVIRMYTRDLLRAVDALHERGIIHRDIKSANIFLLDGCVKLGDFGLSIQLHNINQTAPQEVKDQRGTIPYMAPEVVLKQSMGRPMDIWGVGCVVIEMFTSKRPWFECEENQFAIMFQLGQGHHPAYPKDKSEELNELLDLCFTADPASRANTTQLLAHAFVQVTDDEEDF